MVPKGKMRSALKELSIPVAGRCLAGATVGQLACALPSIPVQPRIRFANGTTASASRPTGKGIDLGLAFSDGLLVGSPSKLHNAHAGRRCFECPEELFYDDQYARKALRTLAGFGEHSTPAGERSTMPAQRQPSRHAFPVLERPRFPWVPY